MQSVTNAIRLLLPVLLFYCCSDNTNAYETAETKMKDSVAVLYNEMLSTLDSISTLHPAVLKEIEKNHVADSLNEVISDFMRRQDFSNRKDVNDVEQAIVELNKVNIATCEMFLKDVNDKHKIEYYIKSPPRTYTKLPYVFTIPLEALDSVQEKSLAENAKNLFLAEDWKTYLTKGNNKTEKHELQFFEHKFLTSLAYDTINTVRANYFPTMDFLNKEFILEQSMREAVQALAVKLDRKGYREILNGKNDYSAIIENIPADILLALNFNDVVDIDTLGLGSVSQTHKTNKENTATKNIPEVAALSFQDFRDFYIFDFFDLPCSHGHKVFDVVKQVLKTYAINDTVLNRVKKIPVNYFQNQEFGDTIIAKWCDKYGQRDEKCVGKPVSEELINRFKNDHTKSPTVYLIALYKLYSDSLPFIISTSFGIKSTHFFVQTALSYNNYTTNYITASLNDTSKLAEDYLEAVAGGVGLPNVYYEPIGSYLQKKKKYGVILVGDKIGPGKYGSMSSKTGSVEILGNGNNWGLENCTSCIQKIDEGTSFATPEISTFLFIAKAVWQKNHKYVEPIEARARLLLSSDIDPLFIGRFASGGTANLEKLVQLSNAYFVAKNDSIETIDSMVTSTIERYLPDERVEYVYEFSKKPGPRSIRGIFCDGDRTFVFSTAENVWKQIPNPHKLNITTYNYGNEKTIQLEKFKELYKEFVLYQ